MVPNWPIFKALGLERGQNCSTWAQNGPIPLVCAPPIVQRYLWKKPIFDSFLTDFSSRNSPFSRHFVTLEWPKWLAMGSKRAHSTCLGTPNGLGSFLEQHIFDPFWSRNSPFSRHFGTLEGPKWLAMGSKWAHFTCLGTPNGLGSFLEKYTYDPFWTHFWSQKSPFSRHFGIFGGPKRATTISKCAKNTCFGIPCGPRSSLASMEDPRALMCTHGPSGGSKGLDVYPRPQWRIQGP